MGVASLAGGMALTMAHCVGALLRGRVPAAEVLRQVHVSGVMCVPVTLVSSLAVGAIVAVQGMDYVRRYSAPLVFGWAAYLSATREVGPLLLGLLVAARVGAFHAAELAALVVTDRWDALVALGVDARAVLVAPRVVALPLSAVMLMLVMNAGSLACATGVAWALGGVTPSVTWGSITDLGHLTDLMQGLGKAAVYGLVAALASTSVGAAARGGADAVGRAVMQAAVAGLVVIVVTNHLLTVWVTQ